MKCKKIFSLSAHNLTDSAGLNLYVDTIFNLHESKSFSQVITRTGIFIKCMNHEFNLNLDSLLKLTICYSPHLIKDDLIKKLLLELANYDASDEIFKSKIPMLIRVQDVIIESVKEIPIFNYQFSSFNVLNTSIKEHLGNTIHKILLNFSPSHPMIFKFFLSSLCNQPPQAAVFDIVPSPENFLLHSKTL